MVNINNLDKEYKRAEPQNKGVTKKVLDYLKANVGEAYTYEELSLVVGAVNDMNFRTLVQQLFNAGKVKRGYKDNRAYVYIEK